MSLMVTPACANLYLVEKPPDDILVEKLASQGKLEPASPDHGAGHGMLLLPEPEADDLDVKEPWEEQEDGEDAGKELPSETETTASFEEPKIVQPKTEAGEEQKQPEPEEECGLAPVLAQPTMQLEQLSGLPCNLVNGNTQPCRLGGAFSFMCTLRMDGVDDWARVFDFSLTADEDSITAGAIELTQDFHFTVFRGRKPISVRVDGLFELGREFTLLCTVSDAGHMKVFRDGVLMGEMVDGLPPLMIDRPHMIVGGHFQFHTQTFRGELKDVKVWNQEVPWPTTCEEGGVV